MAGRKRSPYNDAGQIDVEKVRDLFMASPHIHWTKFAEEQGMNPDRSRSDYPFKTWQEEKRRIFAEKEASALAEMMFDRKFEWHRDVLSTLKYYPKFGDAIMSQLQRRIKHYQTMTDDQFNKDISNLELDRLASAYRCVNEAKQRSLLLSDWGIQKFEDDTQKTEKEVAESTGGISFEMIGTGPMKLEDIQRAMDKYLDKPIEVVAEPKDEDEIS